MEIVHHYVVPCAICSEESSIFHKAVIIFHITKLTSTEKQISYKYETPKEHITWIGKISPRSYVHIPRRQFYVIIVLKNEQLCKVSPSHCYVKNIEEHYEVHTLASDMQSITHSFTQVC